MDSDLSQALIVGGQTAVHPIGLVALILCSYAVLRAKDENVILAILIFIFAIPSGQRVVILNLEFSFLRIVILLSLARAIFAGKFNRISLIRSDIVILLWMVWAIAAYGIQNESVSAIITRTGYMVDASGAYFVGRIYIKSWLNVKRIAIYLGYASIPILVFTLIERATGRNMFSVFGGIPEMTLEREGQLRCQGPFSHPIMAGLFWASMLPWLAVIWVRREANRFLLIIMATGATLIIANTASSTPTMAVILSAVGLLFFRFRRFLSVVNWAAIFLLFSAQLLMEKGAAHLLARVNVVAGSTGWHRYYLIDETIKHVNEWWLVGTRSTEHWGMGLIDITNQYILEGVRGGLLGMIFFVWFLFSIFNLLGKAMSSATNEDCWIYWGAGVVMFTHLFSFISTSYFGQMVGSFYLFAGIIATISVATIQEGLSSNRNNFQ
jgi:hypothetical protein